MKNQLTYINTSLNWNSCKPYLNSCYPTDFFPFFSCTAAHLAWVLECTSRYILAGSFTSNIKESSLLLISGFHKPTESIEHKFKQPHHLFYSYLFLQSQSNSFYVNFGINFPLLLHSNFPHSLYNRFAHHMIQLDTYSFKTQ